MTPPRYRRTSFSPSPSPVGISNNNALGSSTPGSGRSISANYSTSSPLSGKGVAPSPDSFFRGTSIGINRPTNHPSKSPFSLKPRSSSGSPLLQKALTSNTNNQDTNTTFRNSLGGPSSPGSGLRRSQSVREGVEVHSLGIGSRSRSRSPAVNYKWLYEKEKRLQARGVGLGVVGAEADGLLSRSESIQF